MIFTETITKALNEGYEISFKANKDLGPGILDIELRKDGKKCRQLIDVATFLYDETISENIDRAIRYCMFSFDNVKEKQK